MSPEVWQLVIGAAGLVIGWAAKHYHVNLPGPVVTVAKQLLAHKELLQGHAILQDLASIATTVIPGLSPAAPPPAAAPK